MQRLLAFFIAAFATAGATAAQPATAQASAAEDTGAAAAVIEQVNALRARNGLPTLVADPALARAAEDFAQYMARTGRYGHEADGRTPAERAQAQGYAYCTMAENIGWIDRAEPLVPAALGRAFYEGWQGSPPHRHNMLDADVVDTGVGIARRTANGRWYAVQLFGRPRAAEVVFSITDAGAAPVSYRLGERTFTLQPRATRTHRQCHPATLTLAPRAGTQGVSPDTSAYSVNPRNGAHYDAVADRDGWRLEPR
jgi:uncharacterized protein YkwD